MWLIVTLWALIYRWAGGSAEKDIHKMDQFPLGKGKRVCFPLLLPALCCPFTQTLALVFVYWKTSPSHCSSIFRPLCLLWHLLHFQNTLTLVMGLTVPAKTTHTHSHCYLHAFQISFHSPNLISLVARIYSHSNYHFHITAFNTQYIFFPASYCQLFKS